MLQSGRVELPADVDPWAGAVRLWRDPWPSRRYSVYLDWAIATAAITGWPPEEVESRAAERGRVLLRPASAFASASGPSER